MISVKVETGIYDDQVFSNYSLVFPQSSRLKVPFYRDLRTGIYDDQVFSNYSLVFPQSSRLKVQFYQDLRRFILRFPGCPGFPGPPEQ